ncbi:hypothetical protein HED60_05820 [Planctomycetales bacterium ZRK34]|nr:hypothetical protein HED60_05820 [Planctomycetales bacterium ZRK34]
MNWIEQNTADAEMLNRIDLSPLDGTQIEGDDQLVESIDSHNQAITALTARFSKLAEDRHIIADADHWFAHDADTVVTERRRIMAESWDVLVALRRLLDDRADLLNHVEAHMADIAHGLAEELEEALYDARGSLQRKHRQYLKAEPVHGPAYIAAQAESDETVVALREHADQWEQALSSLQSLRHRNEQRAALTFCQREVYEHLN